MTKDEYYAIGISVAADLPKNYSYGQIAARIGLTRQGAHHLTMIALGKLIYGIRKMEGI